jgi:Uma2 family endonuclease
LNYTLPAPKAGREEIPWQRKRVAPQLPSTEAYDRGDKFTYYKSIPSFCEYLLIAQHRPHITHYVKQQDNAWAYEEVNDLDASLSLPSIGCILMLSDVYRDVEITP